VMTVCAGIAGMIAARVFALSWPAAVGFFVLWPPVVYAAAIVGQNAPFGLLLTMLSLAGFKKNVPLLTALPAGLLLYKPMYAVPLIGVMVVRRAWRECSIVGACALVWYVFSAIAAGGDWSWPQAWARLIVRYAGGDLAFNAPLTISATGTLLRASVPVALVVLAVLAVAAAGCIAIARSEPVEAVAGATLLALAWSPHAWAYDAALALPMIAYASAVLRHPLRTRVLLIAYAIAASFIFSRELHFDPLLVITVGGSSCWLAYHLCAERRQGVPA
jgi:hypothetical protein